jgi:hypothetical protein
MSKYDKHCHCSTRYELNYSTQTLISERCQWNEEEWRDFPRHLDLGHGALMRTESRQRKISWQF